ncbi:MAG: L,D-transpeptidase family protein [Candidatus Thiodiazotropha sp. 6PLUC9]
MIQYAGRMVVELYRRCRIGFFVLLLLASLGVANAGTLAVEKQGLVVPLITDLPKGLVLDWPQLEQFYETQQQSFVWHDEGQLNARGRMLFEWLASSVQQGLNPRDYHVDRLRYLLNSFQPSHRFLRELLLTEGYLRLAKDMRLGSTDPQLVDPQWQLAGDQFDPLALLVDALRDHSLSALLAKLKPTSAAYWRLAQALNYYRAIQVYGGWDSLQGEQILRPGARHAHVADLRRRLEVEQRWPQQPVNDADYFDQSLAADLRQFQRRMGLKDDGILGKDTRQALNVSVETRIAQIRLNLERWRWLPNELAARYLLVNTAGFEIELIDQGRTLFHVRTVNGRKERQTPSFNSTVTHLVFNPQWTVPRSIAVKDILPKLQSDHEYLQHKRMSVYERIGGEWQEVDASQIDWLAYHEDNFPFVLKQEAGAGNSLGRIKFHMPNQHDIYLHDTSAPGLFNRQSRALSSGCIRVESADQLARLLMQDHTTQELSVDELLDSDNTHLTSLVNPIPVYLTYFTSWVDESGQIHFRPDIYHRDWQLMMSMGEGMGHFTAEYAASPAGASL